VFHIVATGAAAAQTVIVRKAPVASTVEVVLNGTPAGSATVDANGDAVVPVSLPQQGGQAEMDANIHIDICGEVRRVQVVGRGMRPPAAEGGCDRREILGVFVLRRVTSLVINVGEANPTLLLVQGSYDLREAGPRRAWSRSPQGLVLFGAGGFSSVRDADLAVCGNLTECSAEGRKVAFNVGAALWMTPFLAAEGSYLRPSQYDASGSGQAFRFTGFFDAEVATVAGLVGVPIGAVRPYGKVGMAYQRSTFSTTQSHDDVTVVIDGVSQTIEGSTQTYVFRTTGWGLTYGGGLEAWVNPNFAIYGEVSRVALRGEAIVGEGESDDVLTSVFVGVRLRFGQ